MNDATIKDETLCRCGVWDWVHDEGRGCGNYRKAGPLQLWRIYHTTRRHIAGWLWLTTPQKWRWAIVDRYHKIRPGLDWCDLVDSAYLMCADDYRSKDDCYCSVPLPTDATAPPAAGCYCTPASS